MPRWLLFTLAVLVVGVLFSHAADDDALDKKKMEKDVTKMEDNGVALSILGGVSFVMVAIYMFNHSDPDIMAQSRKVISSTISIFTAVLIFQAINGIILYLFLEDPEKMVSKFGLFVSFGEMIVWFLIVQFFLAGATGVIPFVRKLPCVGDHFDEDNPEDVEQAKERAEVYGIFLGHILAFSGINAWGIIQQMAFESQGIGAAFFVPIVCALTFSAMYAMADILREKIALVGDGKKDEFEKLWDDTAEETENDVIGLVASFLMVQVIRCAITDVHPDIEGHEQKGNPIYILQAGMLACIGAVLVIIEFVRSKYIKSSEEYLPEWLSEHFRLTEYAQNFMAMGFAWCTYYGTVWLALSCIQGHSMENYIQGAALFIVVALLTSTIGFSAVWVMDKFADSLHEQRLSLKHSETVRDAQALADDDHEKMYQDQLKQLKTMEVGLRAVMGSVGILVGFAWEQSFDAAVDQVAETLEKKAQVPAPVWTLLISIIVCIVVVPTWRKHLLSKVEEAEEAETGDGRDSCSSPFLGGGDKVENDIEWLKKEIMKQKEKAKLCQQAKARSDHTISQLMENEKARVDRTNELHGMVDNNGNVVQQLQRQPLQYSPPPMQYSVPPTQS